MPQINDAEMAADWERIRAKHDADDDEPSTPAAEPETPSPPDDVQVAAEKPDADRARDATGKFAKAEVAKPAAAKAGAKPAVADPKAADGQQQATPAADASQAGDQQQQAANASQRDINRPPSTWKPTARAEWDKLPPAVRAEIHRRESDFMAGQHQLLPDAQLGRSMRQVIEPYRLLIESEGGTPDRAVADLLRTAAVLRMGSPQQKYQAFIAMGNQFGVDLRVFGQQQQQGGQPVQPQQQPAEFRDPRVDQLLALQHRQEQEVAARDNAERNSVATRFMNETTADGQPARPYLGDVIDQMEALVPMIRGENPALTKHQVLEQAYDRATWANPEIRALLQQEQQQKAEAARLAANQRNVAGARRAASVNVPRRASTPAAGKPGRLEDTIAETARELGMIS
jgi:hypothetical protein